MSQIFTPQTEAELAETIRAARGPLTIQGGGTRYPLAIRGDVLRTSGLAGVQLYEPGALTLVAAAGTPLAEVEALLAAEGQRLAFEPPDLRRLLGRSGTSTLGGMAAANASGPRRLQVGACRDAMLGLRFVTGAGELVKNGGRVMKNVTGYDLVKLLAGAQGSLGVVTELALRVGPVAETEATLVMPADDLPAGGADVVPQSAGDPAATMARALASPLEVSGAALTAEGQILLRLEGFEASVRYRMAALQRLLGGAVTVITDADKSRQLWRGIRDAEAFATDALVLRLSIRPSRLGALRQMLAAGPTTHRLMADWGGGLVWLGFASADAAARDTLAAVRLWCAAQGGHATIVKLPPEGDGAPPIFQPIFQPEAAAQLALAEGIRRRFDPRGIFNPGLFDTDTRGR